MKSPVEVDDDPRAAYFKQATVRLSMSRMALILTFTGGKSMLNVGQYQTKDLVLDHIEAGKIHDNLS